MSNQPHKVNISSHIQVGKGEKLLIIAGPCQIETQEHALMIAKQLQKICEKLPVNLIYKSSFDKANRTSLESKRGVGLENGLRILEQVKREFGLPVLTDIHLPEQAATVAEVADVLQTPAFLCRQTDLLLAAGQTGKPINCKKGQFLHPADMSYSAAKIASTGNRNIMLCERGTSFGYRDLILDPRSLIIMQEIGYPVIFDATHCVQSMGGASGSSGGARKYIAPLAKAAVTLGVHGLFIECHENPDKAPSDGPSMLPLAELESLLNDVCKLHQVL